MTEDEILLRACEIWMGRMLEQEIATLKKCGFPIPAYASEREWADKMLRSDDIAYNWLFGEKVKIETSRRKKASHD